MDIPERAGPTVRFTSQPPSYTEAIQSPVFVTGSVTPSTPPPSYVEAVGSSNAAAVSPYPVLNIPTEITVHQTQQVFVQQASHSAPPRVLVAPQPEVRRRLGDGPTVAVCRYCHHLVTTVVDYKPGAAAWGWCCLFTFLGLICGCCLIPFCVSAFQDAHHTCPHCNKHLGIYTR